MTETGGPAFPSVAQISEALLQAAADVRHLLMVIDYLKSIGVEIDAGRMGLANDIRACYVRGSTVEQLVAAIPVPARTTPIKSLTRKTP